MDDLCELGSLDCHAKKLEFGLEKEHIVNNAGTTDDEGRRSIGDGVHGDDVGGWTAANAGEDGT